MLRIKRSRRGGIVIQEVSDLRHGLVRLQFVISLGFEQEIVGLSETHPCLRNFLALAILISVVAKNFPSQILIPSLKNFGLVFGVSLKDTSS